MILATRQEMCHSREIVIPSLVDEDALSGPIRARFWRMGRASE